MTTRIHSTAFIQAEEITQLKEETENLHNILKLFKPIYTYHLNPFTFTTGLTTVYYETDRNIVEKK